MKLEYCLLGTQTTEVCGEGREVALSGGGGRQWINLPHVFRGDNWGPDVGCSFRLAVPHS